MKLAITTTVKDCKPYLDIFLAHHFSIGFDHIFMFLDDPLNETVNPPIDNARITVIKNDEELQMRWKKLRCYKHLGKFRQTDLSARQILNVNVALEMARQQKIDWLLHIDIDELFYSPEQDIKEYFQRLSADKIAGISFLNHEAIPARTNATDIFRETTLFKKNFTALNDRQKNVLQRLMVENSTYFNFYGNGKSAVKVTKTANCYSAHDFNLGFFNRLNPFAGRKKTNHSLPLPGILHYACCNFDLFWSKYQTLGNFNDKWLDGTPIKTSVPMHLNSRDVCRFKGIDYARTFYETFFIDIPSANSDEFLKEGIYFEV